MRFINIWFKCRPGEAEQLLAIFRPMLPWIRARDGMLYFEPSLRDAEPDTVLVSECFASDAAHAAMWATPEFRRVGDALDRLVISRRVDVHHADTVLTDMRGDDPPDAGTGRLPPQTPADPP
ncbi:MAG: antibiotic biosynthesis monooxygenase [Devosia sp.]|uniref:putative quinol monooxygenase n=1 Tax=Devosia sp. TaxID=1871048 RepID=UPI001AD06C4F|nr:antibiotic biosynthesis monooxygenase [Devosia sp.]MBN9314671.1 antibiotic biosynthesis monooxygenase [Devosia sp.]